MFFEISERQIGKPGRGPQNAGARTNQPIPSEGELVPDKASRGELDSDALGRLRAFFELLNHWDEQETGREK